MHVCHAECGTRPNNKEINTVLRNSSCAPPSKLNIILCAAAEFKIQYYAPSPNFFFNVPHLEKLGGKAPRAGRQRPLFLVTKETVYDTSSEGAIFDSVFDSWAGIFYLII